MTKLVLAIFGVVVVLTGILLGIYFTQARPGASVKGDIISFVSEKSGYRWEVNQDFVKKLVGLITPKVKQSSKPVLVVLSSGFKTTPDGIGYGNLDPFIFADWTITSSEKVLNIYVNSDIWGNVQEKERNSALSALVSQQILKYHDISGNLLDNIIGEIINNGPVISLK